MQIVSFETICMKWQPIFWELKVTTNVLPTEYA